MSEDFRNTLTNLLTAVLAGALVLVTDGPAWAAISLSHIVFVLWCIFDAVRVRSPA
jgi:hypothetical protein